MLTCFSVLAVCNKHAITTPSKRGGFKVLFVWQGDQLCWLLDHDVIRTSKQGLTQKQRTSMINYIRSSHYTGSSGNSRVEVWSDAELVYWVKIDLLLSSLHRLALAF